MDRILEDRTEEEKEATEKIFDFSDFSKCAKVKCDDGKELSVCGKCRAYSFVENNIECKCSDCEGDLCNSVVGIMSQFNWRIVLSFLVIGIGALFFQTRMVFI
ncbi:hypothetical protein Mgra_00009733 [Meloidogyne graminicola]|uniref:Uncharacterized protein n=1 Tax=Meloidogyne graminicola TaxID=189291 RepID=A0A8S9Z8N6_9BILA|nr:hypothetical protein Mgra_00009733 [Meloidogyne graminicola]